MIQFNARSLMQPLTGVQRYAHEMSAQLAGELSFLKPPEAWCQGVRGHLWEQLCLPRIRDPRKLLWSPGNTGPLGVGYQVVTIHDASTLDHPEWFGRKFAAWYGWLLPRLAQKVRRIITDSEFSRHRLIWHLRVPEDKISVVSCGLSEHFQAQPLAECRPVLQEMNLDRPYFLYVGSLEPRKNLGTLLQAWKMAAMPEMDLVIVGERGRVFESVQLQEDIPSLKFTGRIDNRRLIALYSAAHAFLSPSVYEGFGFPPLEAMACGCPCIVSDIPTHREVAQDGPLYVSPLAVGDWAEAMRQAAAWSDSERERRIAYGLARVAGFSWTRAAAQTRAILEKNR